jgi:chromosomal replication initiator protein
MNAIGNYIVENTNKTVLYVTSEQFINDFTNMTRKEGNENNFDLIEHFKDKYRNIDVLIIDDIQMLQNASKSQDELFQTIDYLKRNNKQIILSSDKSPNDLKIIEDRLKTRFNQGCTVNIDPPDYELKIKILKNKVIGHEISTIIDDEVYDYIANNAPNDVRNLEGSINRLYMNILMFSPKKIDIDFARDALKDLFGSTEYMTNDIAKIKKIVAEYYDVTEESLKSKKRTADINKARQVAMYICKLATDESLQRIGLEFNRNHATVIHSCEKIEEDIKTDEQLKNEIKEIQDKTHI